MAQICMTVSKGEGGKGDNYKITGGSGHSNEDVMTCIRSELQSRQR